MALPAFSTTSSCIHNDMHRRGGAWSHFAVRRMFARASYPHRPQPL